MRFNPDEYVDVATRIERFYEKYPEGSLCSEIVTDDGERVVIKAYAYRYGADATPATGHAEEIRGEGPVNKTSALENAETSAVGRAIAMFGFEVKKSVASREEMQQAQAEEQRQARASKAGDPNSDRGHNGTPASEASVPLSRIKAINEERIAQDVPQDKWAMALTSIGAESLDTVNDVQATKLERWLENRKKAAA